MDTLHHDRLKSERELKQITKQIQFKYIDKPKYSVSRPPSIYRLTNGQNSTRELYEDKFEIMPTYTERLTSLPKLKNDERRKSFKMMQEVLLKNQNEYCDVFGPVDLEKSKREN